MESDRAEQVRPQNCFSSKLLAAIKDFSAGLQIVVDDWQFSGRLPHFLPLLVESCQTTFEVNWPLGQLEQLEILSEQGEALNMLNLRDHVSLNFHKQNIFELIHRRSFWRDLFHIFGMFFLETFIWVCVPKMYFYSCFQGAQRNKSPVWQGFSRNEARSTGWKWQFGHKTEEWNCRLGWYWIKLNMSPI